jgi:hypothetical protein
LPVSFAQKTRPKKMHPRTATRVSGLIHQCIDDMGGKRHIDRLPGLGLIEQEAVAMQTVPFKRHRIADAEPAPAHQ